MGVDFSELRTDAGLEEDGVWTDLGFGLPCRFQVAGQGSSHVRDARIECMRRLRDRKVDMEEWDEEVNVWTTAAKLRNWEKVDWADRDKDPSAKPKPLKYSAENARKLIKGVPRIRDAVNMQSIKFEPYRLEHDPEAQGNSPASSGGSSPGGSRQGRKKAASRTKSSSATSPKTEKS